MPPPARRKRLRLANAVEIGARLCGMTRRWCSHDSGKGRKKYVSRIPAQPAVGTMPGRGGCAQLRWRAKETIGRARLRPSRIWRAAHRPRGVRPEHGRSDRSPRRTSCGTTHPRGDRTLTREDCSSARIYRGRNTGNGGSRGSGVGVGIDAGTIQTWSEVETLSFEAPGHATIAPPRDALAAVAAAPASARSADTRRRDRASRCDGSPR